MLGKPTGFWAKLTKDEAGNVVAWQSVADHSADVAACCEVLLTDTVLRHRLAYLAGKASLTEVQIGRLSFLAALHDLGKHAVGFQNKSLTKPAFTAGHLREVMALFGDDGHRETEHLIAALPLDQMVMWGEDEHATVRLLAAAICHHGRPYLAGGSRDPRNWRPDRGLNPFDGIRELAQRALTWFPTSGDDPADRLSGSPAFQHAFSGLVMLSDWLGSDEHFFPYADIHAADRMAYARQRAAEIARRIGLDAGPARTALMQRLGSAVPDFGCVAPRDLTPRPMQAETLNLPLATDGSLAILEAETGSGKTEAALARYVRMFHAGLVDGLYFALPTRTAATQIYRRVHEAMVRAFPQEDSRPPVVLAVPGYLSVDEQEGRRLARFEVLWNDNEQERFRFRGWAAESSKRYLAGSIVVGTIDQVLLSSLMVSHAHLRASALLRHLLVVDEVHASDAYMTHILEHVLRRHLNAGGHALLMSATIGAATRQRFLRLLAPELTLPPLDAAAGEPFPAISYGAVQSRPNCIAVRATEVTKSVQVERAPDIDVPERIALQALEAAAGGATVLVIRNTVVGCLATQAAMESLAHVRDQTQLLFRCQGLAAPHHSRYAKEDREALDKALEGAFGKRRDSGSGCVVVATQTVQQSLDLDADLMLSDLCPMDVLLQRVGRLHRHRGRGRPSGFRQPRVVVLVPDQRDLGLRIGRDGRAWGKHGIGSVYDDLRILEATWRCLEAHDALVIPNMNRELVEWTTHPEALAIIVRQLGVPWDRHERYVGGVESIGLRLAELNTVDPAAHFGEFEFPSGELARVIQTRLGEGDRLAILDQPVHSPFGNTIRQLTVPYHLAQGVPADAVPKVVAAVAVGIELDFGPIRYRYDRLGLRRLAEARGSEQEDGLDND